VPAPEIKTELRRAGLASPLRAHPAPSASFRSPGTAWTAPPGAAPRRPRSP